MVPSIHSNDNDKDNEDKSPQTHSPHAGQATTIELDLPPSPVFQSKSTWPGTDAQASPQPAPPHVPCWTLWQ